MSQAKYTQGGVASSGSGGLLIPNSTFFLAGLAPSRAHRSRDARLHLCRRGIGKIGGSAGVAEYMQAHGVDGRLLPLVILTELGGGLLVLFGSKTRWAAVALCGFCLLTALFFHVGADQAIQLQKNVAMAGGFLALALLGPGAWSLDAWRARRLS
jgi:putative oxidoreductase